MKRLGLLKALQPILEEVLVVSNIGLPSQELYSLGDRDNYFYMLGSMGLCSSIGMGLALSTDKKVVAVEGDGAVLMNMGGLATIGNHGPANYTLLIIDNGSYGSTGDQPTFTGMSTVLADVARGAGCKHVFECEGDEALSVLQQAVELDSVAVVVVHVDLGNAKVGPIPLHPIIIRERFKSVVGQ